jgi:hypothetical protein
MKKYLLAPLIVTAQPALSHVSDSPAYLHGTEHVLWALALLTAVSVPAGILLRRMLRSDQKR